MHRDFACIDGQRSAPARRGAAPRA
ncbi:hypothetical protein STREPTOSP366_09670, partial [Streptomyces variabilis]